MSWLNKLKSIFEKNKKETEKNIEAEIINFEQIYPKASELSEEHNKKTSQLKKEISEKIQKFNLQITSAVEILQNINLSERKEHEKIKIIVLENLNLYISHLLRLLDSLKNIENLEIKKYIDRIMIIFNNFMSTSNTSFEKATILIGKELQSTKEIIRDFTKEFNSTIEKNKLFLEEIKSLKSLNALLEEIKQINTHEEQTTQKIENFNNEIEKNKLSCLEKKQKIENIKLSEKYRVDILEGKKRQEMLNELEKEFYSIKSKINFKQLRKTFHHDDKKSSLISSYSTNFKNALKEDENLEIIDFLTQAQGIDLSILKQHKLKLFELEKPLIFESHEEISSIEENLKSLSAQIVKIQDEASEELKKKEKSAAKKVNLEAKAMEISKSLFSNVKIR